MNALDFMAIISSLNVADVIAVVIACGALYLPIDFAIWSVRKVAGFFG